MRWIESELLPDCVGAWCPSIARTGTRLVDFSGSRHGLSLVSTSNSDLNPDGLRVNTGRAVSADALPHLIPRHCTFSAWFYPEVLSGTQYIGGAWRNGQRSYMFRLGASELQAFASADGAANSELKATAIPFREWTHVAISIGPQGFRLYRNGSFVDEELSLTEVHQGTAQFSLGTIIFNDPTPLGSNLAGLVDDVQVYARQLEASEIGTLAENRAGLYFPRRRRWAITDVKETTSAWGVSQHAALTSAFLRGAASTLTLTTSSSGEAVAAVNFVEHTVSFLQAAVPNLKAAAATGALTLAQQAAASVQSFHASSTSGLAFAHEARQLAINADFRRVRGTDILSR